jgi:8-oxo-dGTP diphosphatase
MSPHRSDAPRRRGTPVWKRGRVGRLSGGLRDYATTAWWGIVSPRVSESRPLVIAQAVILREGPPREVLLSIRSDLFGWELPGGTLEAGESPIQAVVREVREETGLGVEPVSHVGDWVRRGFRPHTARVYLCRIVGGVESPSHETPRLAWFDVDAPPDALFPWYREPLREALAPGETPFEGEDVQGVATILHAMKIDLAMRWRGLPPSGSS